MKVKTEQEARALLKRVSGISYCDCDDHLYGCYLVTAVQNGCVTPFFSCRICETCSAVMRFVNEVLFSAPLFDCVSTIKVCLVDVFPQR